MTLVTLTPNSTISNTGVVTGAGGVLHTALSDNSIATYDTLTPGQSFNVGLSDLALPTSAVIKTVAVRVSTGGFGSVGPTVNATVLNVTPAVSGSAQVTTRNTHQLTPATVSAIGFTDSEIDAAEISLNCTGVAGAGFDIFEAYLDVRYVTQPVVSVIAPTGTITTTPTPLVDWTDTLDSDGGVQSHYEVKVYTDAQYLAGGFDPASSTPTTTSGQQTASDTAWTVNQPLLNDTYRAYVRVAQTVNGSPHWSNWAFTGFSINLTAADPTIIVTPKGSRIALNLTDLGNANQFEIERSIDGGATWLPFNIVSIPESNQLTVSDYTPLVDQETFYRVRAVNNYAGYLITSGWVTDSATWFAAPPRRQYSPGVPGHPDTGPEVINSFPIPKPSAKVIFDVAPHATVVTLGAFTWDEVVANINGTPTVVVPAMYYHPVGTGLTFTASLRAESIPRNIIEYYWDFGDGTNAIGQVVTHTYSIANPGIIAHVRATDEDGTESFASMNMMLRETTKTGVAVRTAVASGSDATTLRRSGTGVVSRTALGSAGLSIMLTRSGTGVMSHTALGSAELYIFPEDTLYPENTLFPAGN